MTLVEVCVGRLGRAHGIRGDIAVQLRTDEPERRLVTGARFDTAAGKLVIASSKWHSGRLLLHFEGVDDRTAAESLQGVELTVNVERAERPDDPEEYYDHQIVGLRVIDAEGRDRGTVASVSHLGAQDLLAVATPEGERLVPFVAELVPHVDLEAGALHLAAVNGLLDLDGAEEG